MVGGEVLGQQRALQAALREQEAAVADEAELVPVDLVQLKSQLPQHATVEVGPVREQRQDRAVVVVAVVEEEGLLLAEGDGRFKWNL